MPRFKSKISKRSEAYGRNRENMLALIAQLKDLEAKGREHSESQAAKFKARSQITPRERLARMLDTGSNFVEICNIVGHSTIPGDPDAQIPGGAQLAGIGMISGARCMVVVTDSGIQAGTLNSAGGKKIMRCQEIALQNRLPFVHLVESGGGDILRYRLEEFINGGQMFANLARLSAAGLPVITVLHGSSTAGGAYMPGLSDQVIAVKGNAKAFLAGPPLLKAATGEIASADDLGGAEMHATVSGLVEYMGEDDVEAIHIAREVVRRLDWNKGLSRDASSQSSQSYQEPVYDIDELAGVVSTDYRQPYDVREVIARLVDGSEMLDFKAAYGAATVCTQASIQGIACAFIGNNGPIDNAGATKASHFIQYCCQAGLPIIYLQNTTGYMVGVDTERGGMIKNGAKMIQAVSNATVPQITLMIGASFGAGNYGMCGRGFSPDFVFSWPNAQIGLMGAEQAAMTMSMVAKEAAARKGVEISEEVLKLQEEKIHARFNMQNSAFHASGKLMDDGMVDPRHTRGLLSELLRTVTEAQRRQVRATIFGVPRH